MILELRKIGLRAPVDEEFIQAQPNVPTYEIMYTFFKVCELFISILL